MHERWFRSPGDYTAVANARALRKADGTEWAFVVPSAGGVGSALAAGQYRLRASFRRDTTAAAPGSLVLSQVGDTGTEEVVLDIP